jgi:hypothetical protein
MHNIDWTKVAEIIRTADASYIAIGLTRQDVNMLMRAARR